MRVMAVKGTCRWCGLETEKKNVTWHPECVKACSLANDSAAQRRFCYERDHGVCATCGVDETEWQADHIKPIHLANGDPSFFIGDNLQTLCVKCHKEKSKREAAARAKTKT